MKRILVSGFEPFEGDAVNPSMEFLKWIDQRSSDFHQKTVLLPVSFQSAFPQLKEAISEFLPTHVLMTGFAKKRTELTIERIGVNWIDARIPDNDHVQIRARKILPEKEDGLFSTLPVDQLALWGNEIFPSKVSPTAGEYVCNHLLYLYLNEFRNIPGTFIHIPGSSDYQKIFEAVWLMANRL